MANAINTAEVQATAASLTPMQKVVVEELARGMKHERLDGRVENALARKRMITEEDGYVVLTPFGAAVANEWGFFDETAPDCLSDSETAIAEIADGTDEAEEIFEEDNEITTTRVCIQPNHDRYTRFGDTRTTSGRACYDIADVVASALRGLSIDDTYSAVATYLNQIMGDDAMTEEQLIAKYEHLNLGMQRMNLGNKLRAAMNKYGVTELDIDTTYEEI